MWAVRNEKAIPLVHMIHKLTFLSYLPTLKSTVMFFSMWWKFRLLLCIVILWPLISFYCFFTKYCRTCRQASENLWLKKKTLDFVPSLSVPSPGHHKLWNESQQLDCSYGAVCMKTNIWYILTLPFCYLDMLTSRCSCMHLTTLFLHVLYFWWPLRSSFCNYMIYIQMYERAW